MKYVVLTEEEVGLVNMVMLNLANMGDSSDDTDIKARFREIARKCMHAPTVSGNDVSVDIRYTTAEAGGLVRPSGT